VKKSPSSRSAEVDGKKITRNRDEKKGRTFTRAQEGSGISGRNEQIMPGREKRKLNSPQKNLNRKKKKGIQGLSAKELFAHLFRNAEGE